jgi:hypothetical protein
MTQKSAKKKSKKRAKSKADASVLGSLSSTRPSRLGGGRRGAPATVTKAKPKAAAKSKPKKRAAKKAPVTAAQSKATAAQRPSPPPPPPPPPPRRDGRPSGTEIVTTAVQATGELARIGVTVGGELLRRAVRRIPRP